MKPSKIVISVLSLLHMRNSRGSLFTFTLLTLLVVVSPQHTSNKMPWGHKCVLKNVEPYRLLPPNAKYLCPQQTHSMIIRKSKLRRFPAIPNVYPELHTLDVSNNHIILIDSSIFEDAHSLKVLKLSGNNITSLANYTFTGASFLVRLDLKRCGITDINIRAFLGLSQLAILDLSQNRIKKLTSGIFDHIIKLTVLNLGSNEIEMIDNRILVRQILLRTLILSKNQLKKIQKHAFMTANLAMLDLDHNPTLEYLQLDDKSIEDIETLKVNNCSLETLFVPPNAIAVEATHNNISYIVPARAPNTEGFLLRRLNLDHNRLTHFGNLTALNLLEMLDLNDNLITTLNVTQLRFLNQLKLIQVARNPLEGSIDVDGIALSVPLLQELTISQNKYNDPYLSEVRRNLSVHKIMLIIDEEEEVSPAIIDPLRTTDDETEIPTIPMPRTAEDLRKMIIKMRYNYQVDWLSLLQLETNNTRILNECTSMVTSTDRIQKRKVSILIWMCSIVILGAIGIICRIFLKWDAIRRWFDGPFFDTDDTVFEQPLRAASLERNLFSDNGSDNEETENM